MRLNAILGGVLAFSLAAAASEATISRVVVVQAADVPAYLKAIEQGRALMKAKGNVGVIRVWRARFAGSDTGAVVVSIEYPNMEALAKDDHRAQTDPELRAWFQGLDKIRKVVSDSIYEELVP